MYDIYKIRKKMGEKCNIFTSTKVSKAEGERIRRHGRRGLGGRTRVCSLLLTSSFRSSTDEFGLGGGDC